MIPPFIKGLFVSSHSSSSPSASSNIDGTNSKGQTVPRLEQLRETDELLRSSIKPMIKPHVDTILNQMLDKGNQSERENENEKSQNKPDESRLSPARRKRLISNFSKGPDSFTRMEDRVLKCYEDNSEQPLKCSQQINEYRQFLLEHRQSQLVTMSLIALVTLHIVAGVHCLGSMSVDVGSEWMKVGLVAPSVQMDIVLNQQSQRKTPMAISFHNGERFIGDSAADIASKHPEKTFTHFLDLLGKPIDHEAVKIYKRRFPYANITENENGVIVLNHPEGNIQFTALELVAMMLEHAHDQVLESFHARSPSEVGNLDLEIARDVVLTVPVYFTNQERLEMQQAAQLIGLNVLQLINSNSAFALSYGIFRHNFYQPQSQNLDPTSENKTSIIFYDQGASSTSVILADYYLASSPSPSSSSLNTTNTDTTNSTSGSQNQGQEQREPTITVRAMAFDRFLGGFEMQLRLRDFLAKTFAKQSGIELGKIQARGKSMAKLLKEAGRVKKVLSVNTDYVVRVENVMNDKDLRVEFSRQEFEDLCSDLLEGRTTKIIDRLLEISNFPADKIEKFIIVGGNTRTPKVQRVIQEHLKLSQLDKQINADEGAALAALYLGASKGRGFRVKKFNFNDIPPFNSFEAALGDSVNPISLEEFHDESLDSNRQADNNSESIVQSKFKDQHLEQMRTKLRNLKQQDTLRLQRLSLKNSLESLLGDIRHRLDVIANENIHFQTHAAEIKKLTDETSEWFDKGSQETDNVDLLIEKLTKLRKAITPPPPPPPPPTTTTTTPAPAPVVVPPNATNIGVDQELDNSTLQDFVPTNEDKNKIEIDPSDPFPPQPSVTADENVVDPKEPLLEKKQVHTEL